MWTIEINLDQDPTHSTAYHIDREDQTINTNMRMVLNNGRTETGHVAPRFVVIGFAHTLQEANEKCKKLQKMICDELGKSMKCLDFAD